MPVRIKILLALHLLAVPLGAFAAAEFHWTQPHPFGVVVISLMLSDSGLLGLWGGVGRTRWWLRSGSVAVLLVCLSLGLFTADHGVCGLELDYVVMVALPPIVISFLLLFYRRKGRLLLTRSIPLLEDSNEFQFSLTHMLLATAIIASAFAIRTGLQEFGNRIHLLAFVACSLIVNAATFWSALGLRSPLIRLLIVVPGVALLGLIFPILSSSSPTIALVVTEVNVLWSAVFGCQALFTAATLLIFRSCGWRLCRGAIQDDQRPIANTPNCQDLEPAAEPTTSSDAFSLGERSRG